MMPASPMKLSKRGVPQVVVEEPARSLERLELGEAPRGALQLSHGNCTIQDVERRRRDALEHFVEAHDLGPVGGRIRGGETVLCRDARLRVIARHRVAPSGAREVVEPTLYELAIPERAILLLEEHEPSPS